VKIGRPTKLTPEIQVRIETFLGAGAYIETAAAAAGITKKSLYDWLRRGAEGEEPYLTFLHAVERAQAEADMRDLTVIRTAAQDGQWTAAAWRLERRHPRQWGRFDRVETNEVKVDALAEKMRTDEEVAALADELIARIAGDGESGGAGTPI